MLPWGVLHAVRCVEWRGLVGKRPQLYGDEGWKASSSQPTRMWTHNARSSKPPTGCVGVHSDPGTTPAGVRARRALTMPPLPEACSNSETRGKTKGQPCAASQVHVKAGSCSSTVAQLFHRAKHKLMVGAHKYVDEVVRSGVSFIQSKPLFNNNHFKTALNCACALLGTACLSRCAHSMLSRCVE